MARRIIALCLLCLVAPPLAALDGPEIQARAAASTVVVTTEGAAPRESNGILISLTRGLIVTREHVVRDAEKITVHLRGGLSRSARVQAIDKSLQLALLEVGDLRHSTALPAQLGELLRADADLTELSLFSISRTGSADTPSWKAWPARLFGAEPARPPGLEQLMLLRHDATTSKADGGAPLLDSEGRVIGMHVAGWKALGESSGTFALPINAIIRFLERATVRMPSSHWKGALPIRYKDGANEETDGGEGEGGSKPETPRRHRHEDAHQAAHESAVPAAPQLTYGPYRHYYESRGKADLKARVNALLKLLHNLEDACPQCRGAGTIRVKVRERRYDRVDDAWRPAVYERQVCPLCEGRRVLFQAAKAERFVNEAFAPLDRRHRAFEKVREGWMKRLFAARLSFPRAPRLSFKMHGRRAIVTGTPTALFPLAFGLRPTLGGYQWFLLDPALGHDERDETIPTAGKIIAVHAGDILELEGGQILRLCGVTIPNGRGKVADAGTRVMDQNAREHMQRLLMGKRVELEWDRYARVTYEGHAIVYVLLDGNDVGQDLIRRGIARLHPKHAHVRKTRYLKERTKAQRENAGIWAD
ncbi:MAG: trypsin-like peptidase domain-containing protein [Planctomycetota bacterium]